jgi:hypothetical protein
MCQPENAFYAVFLRYCIWPKFFSKNTSNEEDFIIVIVISAFEVPEVSIGNELSGFLRMDEPV